MTGQIDSGARIATSWLVAAEDLHIAVEIRAGWHCSAGAEHVYVYLRDFGGPHGSCAGPLKCYQSGAAHEWADHATLGEQVVSCYVSFLGNSYEAYDRDRFAATLDDWRWFGQGTPPAWYTGRPWGGQSPDSR